MYDDVSIIFIEEWICRQNLDFRGRSTDTISPTHLPDRVLWQPPKDWRQHIVTELATEKVISQFFQGQKRIWVHLRFHSTYIHTLNSVKMNNFKINFCGSVASYFRTNFHFFFILTNDYRNIMTFCRI